MIHAVCENQVKSLWFLFPKAYSPDLPTTVMPYFFPWDEWNSSLHSCGRWPGVMCFQTWSFVDDFRRPDKSAALKPHGGIVVNWWVHFTCHPTPHDNCLKLSRAFLFLVSRYNHSQTDMVEHQMWSSSSIIMKKRSLAHGIVKTGLERFTSHSIICAFALYYNGINYMPATVFKCEFSFHLSLRSDMRATHEVANAFPV